jgi:hypothetical protein
MRCDTRRTRSSPRNSFGKAGARIAMCSVHTTTRRIRSYDGTGRSRAHLLHWFIFRGRMMFFFGPSQERAQSLPQSGNDNCAGRGLDVTAGRGCAVGCLHRRRHGIEGGVAGFVGSALRASLRRGAVGRHWPSQVASVLSRRTGALRLLAPMSAPESIAFPFSRRSRGGPPVSCLARRLFLPCPQSQCRCYSFDE